MVPSGQPGAVLPSSNWGWEEVVPPCGYQRGPCDAGGAGEEQEIRRQSRIQSRPSRVVEPTGNGSMMACIH